MNKSKREQLVNWFLDALHQIQPKNKNIELYRQHFNELTDEAFTALMAKLKTGEVVLPFYASNLEDESPDLYNLYTLAEKIGVKFTQRLWLTDPVSKVRYKTTEEYFITDSIIRRQIQHVESGKSVVDNSDQIDMFTGQPTGGSRTARISLPELMTLAGANMHNVIEELITVRGGSAQRFRMMRRDQIDSGHATLESSRGLGEKVTANETFNALMRGMHFTSNF